MDRALITWSFGGFAQVNWGWGTGTFVRGAFASRDFCALADPEVWPLPSVGVGVMLLAVYGKGEGWGRVYCWEDCCSQTVCG